MGDETNVTKTYTVIKRLLFQAFINWPKLTCYFYSNQQLKKLKPHPVAYIMVICNFLLYSSSFFADW